LDTTPGFALSLCADRYYQGDDIYEALQLFIERHGLALLDSSFENVWEKCLSRRCVQYIRGHQLHEYDSYTLTGKMDLACLGNINTVLVPEVLLEKLGLDATDAQLCDARHRTGPRSYT